MKTISIFRSAVAAVMMFISSFSVFAQVNLPIGNLAPGDSVTVYFDVTPTNPFPAGLSAITNQSAMTGSNFSSINSDDPTTNPRGDATVTAVEAPPFVLTLAATGVTPTNATLNASINPSGLAGIVYFEFGLTTNYGSFTPTNVLTATNIALLRSAFVTNLAAGLYHFRATATNIGGRTFGNDVTFATIPIPPPQLNNLSLLPGGLFHFAFTNFTGQSFTVLGTTNVALPASNWTVLGPVTEGPPGQFQFTDPQAATDRQRFYRVRWP